MDNQRIKFRHIQCFVEIVRQESLKKAAERLFLTQPAISKTLKELEEIVGAVLLHRSRAGIRLSQQGEVFHHFAEMSLAALQQGVDGVEQIGKSGNARLLVGALPSVAAGLMPVVAKEFGKLSPATTLCISDGPHGYLIDRLRHGELALIIGRLGPPQTMQGLSFTQLYNEHVVFVVRPGHPMSKTGNLDDLADWPIVYPPENAAIRALVERILIANGIGELPNRIETVSGAFGRVYTRDSDAIWIISYGVVANELAEGRLVALPVDTSITKGPVGLMTRQDHEKTPEERLFHSALSKAIAQLGLTST
ncbi:MAG: pca operon transcription factor PcaQ [Rhodobacteraceae bacterium]|nr:pca operon transcription factor PcaQ [Paracoccaceae bacterium]